MNGIPRAVKMIKSTFNKHAQRFSLAEELVEAAVTIRLIVLLLKRACRVKREKKQRKLDIHDASHPHHFLTFVQLLQAKRANEMFRVKFAEHRGNAATCDGLGATSAQRATFGVVMRLAIRHSLVVEERAAIEGLSTILRKEKKGK